MNWREPVETKGHRVPFHLALVDADVSIYHSVREVCEAADQKWQVSIFTNGEQALADISAAPPHVVLMERFLRGKCGLDCTRKLRARLPDLPVVMFTGQAEAGTLLNALRAGACGYLIKPLPPADLLPYLCKAMTGGLALCHHAERLLLEGLTRLGQENHWGLTHREQEAMLCLCRHKSDKEISATMGLATATVQVHLKHAFKKLGVHGRIQAIEKYLSTVTPGGKNLPFTY